MTAQTIFEPLLPYVVEKPHPLMDAKTIQIIFLREILDFTVLRTEETRELNTVTTPLSVTEHESVRRVAFLATKQKAAESRELERMLRTATKEAKTSRTECYLKDHLCLECPRCALFGGTNTRSGSEKIGNIKHRIEYSTAFSLMSFADIGTATTFNAIDDATQKTRQALGTRYAVIPATVFPSIVTLRSVTLSEFILAIKTLLATKSYGAEARVGGDVRNSIFGIVAGWEEVITSLELTLELYDRRKALTKDTIRDVVESYQDLCGNPDQVKLLQPDEVDNIVGAAAKTKLDGGFLEAAYQSVAEYRAVQKAAK